MIWKVQCNDGTMDEGNPSKAPCINNGGIKPINIDLSKPFLGKPDLSQQIAQQQAQLELAKLESEKAMYDAQKNKTKEPIYYILVTAGVMIAGYFAYKKFKK